MPRDPRRYDRFEDEQQNWTRSQHQRPRGGWDQREEHRGDRYSGEYGQSGYGRGAGWRNDESGRHYEEDDESYFRRGRPEHGGKGYIGGERNQGYIGFGTDQGFWRSSDREADRGRGYDENYSRDYGSERPGQRGWWDRASDEVASWMGDDDAERRRRMDEARSHRGRGPRGYARSDDRIKDDVNDRLTDDHYLDASEIDVEVNAGEVTLSGTVSNRGDKRRAEDLAEAISGVRHVQNNLRVKAQHGTWDQPPSAVGNVDDRKANTMATGKSGTVPRKTSSDL